MFHWLKQLEGSVNHGSFHPPQPGCQRKDIFAMAKVQSFLFCWKGYKIKPKCNGSMVWPSFIFFVIFSKKATLWLISVIVFQILFAYLQISSHLVIVHWHSCLVKLKMCQILGQICQACTHDPNKPISIRFQLQAQKCHMYGHGGSAKPDAHDPNKL